MKQDHAKRVMNRIEEQRAANVAETSGRLAAELASDDAEYRPPAPDCDVLLIDLSSIFHPAWHVSKDLEVGRAFEDTIRRVAQLRDRIPHQHVALCCDWPPYWRKQVSVTYKAHRDTPTGAFVEQFRRTRERLKKDGLLVWSAQGFEADDVIATATEQAVRRKLTVTIATGDKDLAQLVSERVKLFSVQKEETSGPEEVFAKFGAHPSKIRDLLALCGDSSDNIPGVPGVGPKKAAGLIATFASGPAALLAAKEGDERITPAMRKALAEHQGFDVAFQLVGLRYDVPIKFEELFEERRPEKLETRSYDMGEAAEAEYESGEHSEPEATEKHAETTKPEPAQTNGNSRAIVRAAPSSLSFDMQLEPTSMTTALAMSKALYESRLYQKFTNPESIFAVIVRGREMGLGALTALDCFHVIEGKPAPYAHLIVARAKQDPECEYFKLVSSDAKHAKYKTKSRLDDEPTELTYTYQQAVQAGVAPANPRTQRASETEKDSRGQWEKRPEEMLRKTCAVQLARIVYPSAAMGLYAVEELNPNHES